MAVLVAVAQEVRTGAVSIIALKLAQPAVAGRAGGGLVWAVSAVPLTVTLPPDRNTSVEAEVGPEMFSVLHYVKKIHVLTNAAQSSA